MIPIIDNLTKNVKLKQFCPVIYTDIIFNLAKKLNWLRCIGGESYMQNTGQNLSNDINVSFKSFSILITFFVKFRI